MMVFCKLKGRDDDDDDSKIDDDDDDDDPMRCEHHAR